MKYVVFVLALLVSSDASAGSSQPYGKGGYIARFQPVIDQYNASGELMRIEGHCQSLSRCSWGCATCVSSAVRGCCFIPAITGGWRSTPPPPRG
jgi:hypothetical protein